MLTKIGKIVGWSILTCFVIFVIYAGTIFSTKGRELIQISSSQFNGNYGYQDYSSYTIHYLDVSSINGWFDKKTVWTATTESRNYQSSLNQPARHEFRKEFYLKTVDCQNKIWKYTRSVYLDQNDKVLEDSKWNHVQWNFYNFEYESHKKEYNLVCN
jgi:hypothetical protein